MGGELEDDVHAAVDAEPEELGDVGVVGVDDDAQLRQEVAGDLLRRPADQLLDGDQPAVRQPPPVHLRVPALPDQVLCRQRGQTPVIPGQRFFLENDWFDQITAKNKVNPFAILGKMGWDGIG